MKVPGGYEHILNMRAHLDSELVPHYLLRELSESIQYLHPPATNKEYSQCVIRRYSNPIGEFGSCIIFSILGIFTWEFGFSCLAKPLQIYSQSKMFPEHFFQTCPQFHFKGGFGLFSRQGSTFNS